MAEPLQYLLFTVKVIALEKFSFSDTQNPKSVNTLTVNEKQYLITRDNLTQKIQMEFSKNQKKNFQFSFLHF